MIADSSTCPQAFDVINLYFLDRSDCIFLTRKYVGIIMIRGNELLTASLKQLTI